MKRLAIALAAALACMSPAIQAQTHPLKSAMDAARKADWPAAATAAAPLGPVASDIVEWMRLRTQDAPLGEFEAFLARRPDWPGLAPIRAQGEEAVARSTTPARVLAWFGTRDPVSAAGAVALLRALRAANRPDDATAMLRRVWPSIRLDAEGQGLVLAEAGTALDATAHAARLDALLWDQRLAEARAMLPLVSDDWKKLATARLALQEDLNGVDQAVAAVPRALAEHPGLAHARFEWRARKGRTEGALEILMARSATAESLGRPEAWANRRALMARAALRDGNGAMAYRIASAHRMDRGAAAADLEWLAGFAALRFTRDAAAALGHFQRLRQIVGTPISISRAEYWEGMAFRALGQQDAAQAALTRAAEHQTAYYGLLAAETLGRPLAADLVRPAPLPDWRKGAFLNSSLTEAGLLLYQAGEPAQARRFLLHLADGLDNAELGALGALALDKGDPHLAVLVGKAAAARGIILPAIYYPDPALLPEGLAVERPLALAIARRESEFLVEAVSPAGALGLMQLMPGTGKLMAQKLSLPFDQARLTNDPAYNANLGAGYLAHLAEEFGSSLALRAAGYNAGPGRPRAWIQTLGDPRQPSVDVIDWVEMVPFTETRTYIMRVAEGAVIYGGRAGQSGPVNVTGLLRGK